MDFLYKLYDLPHFGIILFLVIAILLVLFLVILFFGKKDEKKKLEETRKLELAKTENVEKIDDNTKEIKVPEIEQPTVIEQPKKEEVVDKVEVKPEVVEENNEKVESNIDIPIINNAEKEEIDLSTLFDEPEKDEEPVFEPEETPVAAPAFELPKMAELPKLKEEVKEEPKEDIFGNDDTQKESNINNIFDNIENETYNIK